MTETVTRHRGGGRDENGGLIPTADDPLQAFAVAPGSSPRYTEREREGVTIVQTVYFTNRVDLTNADELTVRGQRFSIVVNDWRSPWTDHGGLEVLCTRGQG